LRAKEDDTLHDIVLLGIVGSVLGRNLENGWDHLARKAVLVDSITDLVSAGLRDEYHADVRSVCQLVKLLFDVNASCLGIDHKEVLLALPIDMPTPCQHHSCDCILVTYDAHLHVSLANESLLRHGWSSDTRQASKKVKTDKPQVTKVSPSKTQQATPKKTEASKTITAPTMNPKDAERMREVNAKTLFMKNIPKDCSESDIKALSKDIKHVRLRVNVNRRAKPVGYAYIEFASEQVAEKNFKLLSKATVKGQTPVVDYVGEKSTFQPKKPFVQPEYDPCKLYVAGIPEDTTEGDLRKLFPKAQEIALINRGTGSNKTILRYCFILFKDAELAKQYHTKNQSAEIKGNKLVVLYAKKKVEQEVQKSQQTKKAKENTKKTKQQSKQAKKEEIKVEEDEEDDEEEDDESEEEDMEDDDDDDDDEDDEEDDDDDDEDDDGDDDEDDDDSD